MWGFWINSLTNCIHSWTHILTILSDWNPLKENECVRACVPAFVFERHSECIRVGQLHSRRSRVSRAVSNRAVTLIANHTHERTHVHFLKGASQHILRPREWLHANIIRYRCSFTPSRTHTAHNSHINLKWCIQVFLEHVWVILFCLRHTYKSQYKQSSQLFYGWIYWWHSNLGTFGYIHWHLWIYFWVYTKKRVEMDTWEVITHCYPSSVLQIPVYILSPIIHLQMSMWVPQDQ